MKWFSRDTISNWGEVVAKTNHTGASVPLVPMSKMERKKPEVTLGFCFFVLVFIRKLFPFQYRV
jgi:hypothetical protein